MDERWAARPAPTRTLAWRGLGPAGAGRPQVSLRGALWRDPGPPTKGRPRPLWPEHARLCGPGAVAGRASECGAFLLRWPGRIRGGWAECPPSAPVRPGLAHSSPTSQMRKLRLKKIPASPRQSPGQGQGAVTGVSKQSQQDPEGAPSRVWWATAPCSPSPDSLLERLKEAQTWHPDPGAPQPGLGGRKLSHGAADLPWGLHIPDTG